MEGFTNIFDMLQNDLPEPPDNRRNQIPPDIQLKAALRFYATGNFQIVAGDLSDISLSTFRKVDIILERSLSKSQPLFFSLLKSVASFPIVRRGDNWLR